MLFAIGAACTGRLSAEMETCFSRIADRPLAKPVGYRIEHCEGWFRGHAPRRQAEPMGFADHRVSSDVTQGFRNLPCRKAFPPQFFKQFNALRSPFHADPT